MLSVRMCAKRCAAMHAGRGSHTLWESMGRIAVCVRLQRNVPVASHNQAARPCEYIRVRFGSLCVCARWSGGRTVWTWRLCVHVRVCSGVRQRSGGHLSATATERTRAQRIAQCLLYVIRCTHPKESGANDLHDQYYWYTL